MKNALLFALFLVLLSCKKETKTAVSDCLNDKIEAFKQNPDAVAILKTATRRHGDVAYWLETDARFHDGFEFILDEKCDTVCSIGGFSPSSDWCIDISKKAEMEIIWKK